MTAILEIDAGNTFVKWRLLDSGLIKDRGKIPTSKFQAQSISKSIGPCLDVVRLTCVLSGKVKKEVEQIANESAARLFSAMT